MVTASEVDRRAMIEAGSDTVRRLRTMADDIEGDVVALGGVRPVRRYCVQRCAVWGTVAGIAGLLSWLGVALTS